MPVGRGQAQRGPWAHADRMISIQTNPFFTMSRSRTPCVLAGETVLGPFMSHENGGADRDRTGDLKLAKLALSQLSYGPFRGQ